MCTVTYIPLKQGAFILTSNRDERTERPTSLPMRKAIAGNMVIFPKDLEAGGTWIAAGDNGRTACLLNGAFTPHDKQQKYPISRGSMLIALFEHDNIYDFFSQIHIHQVEPFTLVIMDMVQNPVLTLLIWDGRKKHIRRPDASKPHLWASVTLYDQEDVRQRRKYFYEWLDRNKETDKELIYTLHLDKYRLFAGNKHTTQSKNVQTLSITQVEYNTESLRMYYHDLLGNHFNELKCPIKTPHSYERQICK